MKSFSRKWIIFTYHPVIPVLRIDYGFSLHRLRAKYFTYIPGEARMVIGKTTLLYFTVVQYIFVSIRVSPAVFLHCIFYHGRSAENPDTLSVIIHALSKGLQENK